MILIRITILLIFSTSAFSEEVVCYKNIPYYLKSKFGEKYHEDENIIFKKTKNKNIFLIIDRTANNSPEHFIIVKKNKLYCEILDAPMSYTINFNNTYNTLPKKIVTKSLGNPTKQIEYKMTSTGIYKMNKCKIIFDNLKEKNITCDKIYE